jgi:hypothetical protein
VSTCKRFVLNVIERKMGVRQAARAAGFAQGVPSPQARRLLKMAQLIRETPGMADAVARDHALAQSALARAADKAASASAWHEALTILKG